ncbi:hypothetical protein JWG39_16045, partial [Desulforhopalus vacuolatus]|uniref:hypothetical protein n=1 Tax=Desulforhopalus vacuolatus TaxID=40414 RepID=UPI0019639403
MLLKRGPVDAMVFSPERVDYSAPALMGKGLHQLPQRPVFTPGDLLNTSLLPDLTTDEKKEVEAFWRGERERLKPELKHAENTYINAEVIRTGESLAVVRTRVYSRNTHGIISPDTPTERGKLRDVAHGKYIDNPVELSDAQARVFVDTYGKTLHSFRHGGQQYSVCNWQQ